MHSDNDAPGYKARCNKDGTIRHLWVARADLVRKGYTPKTVRLHYDNGTAEGRLLISAACKKLQAEMLAWGAGYDGSRNRLDGTLASLIRRYQCDPTSPHVWNHKWNTQRTDNQVMGVIERAFGKRALATLRLDDFVRWYDEAAKPKAPGGRPRLTKASKIIKMLRELFGYGSAIEDAECKRLKGILRDSRFKQPGRLREKVTAAMVRAFTPVAMKAGRLSLTLGTNLQFDTGMRQRDVIGEWAPVGAGDHDGGIMLRGRCWQNGLTWADLNTDFVIGKATTKTGAVVSHDLKIMPEVMALLMQVPLEKRVGPIIIDETAGRPYAEGAYAREWRIIARAAGISDEVRNMDSRAGAITEAEDAGAELDEIRSSVGHTNTSSTVRYLRGAIGKSRKVAERRQAHRKHDGNN